MPNSLVSFVAIIGICLTAGTGDSLAESQADIPDDSVKLSSPRDIIDIMIARDALLEDFLAEWQVEGVAVATMNEPWMRYADDEKVNETGRTRKVELPFQMLERVAVRGEEVTYRRDNRVNNDGKEFRLTPHEEWSNKGETLTELTSSVDDKAVRYADDVAMIDRGELFLFQRLSALGIGYGSRIVEPVEMESRGSETVLICKLRLPGNVVGDAELAMDSDFLVRRAKIELKNEKYVRRHEMNSSGLFESGRLRCGKEGEYTLTSIRLLVDDRSNVPREKVLESFKILLKSLTLSPPDSEYARNSGVIVPQDAVVVDRTANKRFKRSEGPPGRSIGIVIATAIVFSFVALLAFRHFSRRTSA